MGISSDIVTLAENGGIADVGITSNSAATGIAGGSQQDYGTNQGSIVAAATSTATQTEVGVGIGFVDVLVPIPDLGLVGAGTKADARATGMDAGSGDDTIFNAGLVKAEAKANASTVGVSFSLSVFSVGPQLLPISAGLTAADVATTASAQAVGIAGGSGDDAIHNTGQVQTQATANGGAVGVAATVNIEYEKGEKSFGLDVTAARAVTDAKAKAVGIDGGGGRNDLQNAGGVTAGAYANATAVAATVGVAGNLRGPAGLLEGSATDTSSTVYAQGKLTQAQGRNGLWLDSFGQKGQGGSANGTGGFDSSLNGTSFGFDYAPSKGIVSGVSAGCSGDRIGLGENLGQGNIQAAFTSAYGSYATKYSYLEAVFSYTRNQYEIPAISPSGPSRSRFPGITEGRPFHLI